MTETPKGDVTQLLLDWSNGREDALDDLMSIVYAELHRLAKQLHAQRAS